MNKGGAHLHIQNQSVTDMGGICSYSANGQQVAARRWLSIHSSCSSEEPAEEERSAHHLRTMREAQGGAILAALMVRKAPQRAYRGAESFDATAAETTPCTSTGLGHAECECHGCGADASVFSAGAGLVCDDPRDGRCSSRAIVSINHMAGQQIGWSRRQTGRPGFRSHRTADRRSTTRMQSTTQRGRARRRPRAIPRTAATREETGPRVISHSPPPVATDGEAANPGPRLRRRGPRSAIAREKRRERRRGGSTTPQPDLEELFSTSLTMLLVNIRSLVKNSAEL